MYHSYYYTNYDPYYYHNTGAFLGLGLGMLLFMILLGIGLYVYTSITLGKIFKKAGREAWAGWIPFFNMWRLFEMGDFNGAMIFLSFIPVAGPIITGILTLIASYRIGLKFGKDGAFVLLAIFIQPVWLGILAFDKSKWHEKIAK